jgi:hypothetical protein
MLSPIQTCDHLIYCAYPKGQTMGFGQKIESPRPGHSTFCISDSGDIYALDMIHYYNVYHYEQPMSIIE